MRRQVIFQKEVVNAGKRLLDGRRLRNDVDAIFVFTDHLFDAAKLALDDLEPPERPFL
jgi:hypothetical protein